MSRRDLQKGKYMIFPLGMQELDTTGLLTAVRAANFM